jgi:hypothetical protein
MREHRMLVYGVGVSLLLLVSFFILQGVAAHLLQVPVQWLWVVLVPVLLAVVAGGYIGKFKASGTGVEFELPDKGLEHLREVSASGTQQVPQVKASWQSERAGEYERASGLCLVHVYTPSKQKGQVYDAFVYLVRHQKDSTFPVRIGLTEVKQVEFYFGAAWGHQVFTVPNTGSSILGVRAHAFGTFLATCRVTFSDEMKTPVILHRYIDCEMLADKSA